MRLLYFRDPTTAYAARSNLICDRVRVVSEPQHTRPLLPANQILSGNLMMKLPRLGSFTLGRVCASMVSFSPMNLLSANT